MPHNIIVQGLSQLVKKFPTLIEPEGSLPCSQKLTIGTYAEQV